MLTVKTETWRNVHLEGDNLVGLLEAAADMIRDRAPRWTVKDVYGGAGYQPTDEERAAGAEPRAASVSVHFEEARA